jgi:hypothetical protein
MDADGVRQLLRDACRNAGGVRQFAEAAGVSTQLVYAVAIGRQQPGDKILDALGLERVVFYQRKARS